jgi:hypothetical protein
MGFCDKMAKKYLYGNIATRRTMYASINSAKLARPEQNFLLDLKKSIFNNQE